LDKLESAKGRKKRGVDNRKGAEAVPAEQKEKKGKKGGIYHHNND